ncbi:MAG: fibro-slime domain-containing protein [Nannocystaceae bacterium]|nr:fibro-slime domain-containing protein [Nannocystaceae bacterium]
MAVRGRTLLLGTALSCACGEPAPRGGGSDSGTSVATFASFGDGAEDPAGSGTAIGSSSSGGPDTITSTVTSDVTSSTTASTTTATSLDTTDSATGGSSSTGTDTGVAPCESIAVVIRDLPSTHPDMSAASSGSVVPGLVSPALGDDDTPTLDPMYMGIAAITSVDSFAQWYHDSDGNNVRFDLELPLAGAADGLLVFDAQAYFPIDGQGFGDEGNGHNYFFTTALHTTIVVDDTLSLGFTADDDLWVFLDRQLVVDMGGRHSATSLAISLGELGLVNGQEVALDLFYAERGVAQSVLHFEIPGACAP